MKRSLIIIGIVLVIGLLSIPKFLSMSSSPAQNQESSGTSSPLSVEAIIVTKDTLEDKIFTTGTLIANEEVDLVSESSGLIQAIYLQEGQKVEKGELLLKINDSELQAQLRRAEFRLNLAVDREKRQKQLLEQGGISQEEYDATLNEVNVMRAEVALIHAQIDKTELRAPFTGRLGLKYVSEGGYISSNTRIATLQDIQRIKIDFSIPERYSMQIKEGTNISFTIQGLNDTLSAEVYAKEPRIDTETRSLQVRAQSENQKEQLLPGAFADLELTLNTIEDALMVPSISLVPEINGQKVFVIRNGVVQPQSVTTGIRNESKVQILKGIAEGDTVLTTGLLQVRPGMKVTIKDIRRD